MAAQHLDLCRTCNNEAACMNRGTPERPKFYCEQFDARVPVSPAASNRTAGNTPEISEPSGNHKGLCLTCEDREICSLPRPEGGVWHCGEYR